MKVLYHWLKEFVDLTATPENLRTRLSLSGTAIEALEQTAAGPLLDAELTSNRADCLGHYGIAREAAVLYGLPLKRVDPRPRESSEQASAATRVQIDSAELCGRYTARVLRGVKVGPSPDWLRQRLEALGQASINNVVDATNYVMLELGHPLHAFDMDLLAEKRILVRRARAGEKMRTLDGVERALSNEMCVIADAARAVAIAGVMGGGDTEIRSASRAILLESAWFDPISIRRTSKALGLRTEASMRFERAADIEMAETASRRCAELIQQLGGGEVLAGAVDVYPGHAEAPRIELTRQEFLRVMGADVPDLEIEAILGGLGFKPARSDATRGLAGPPAAAWTCRRPSWRADVTREVDLIEEVARIYGVDKFPARLPAAKLPAARLEYAEADDRLRELLIGLGYQEIITIPIVDEPSDAIFRPEGATPARIANPLAEDASVMRSTGAITMARTLEWNLNHGQRNVRLFEFGKTYGWNGTQPVETRIVTLGATGLAREKSIAESERAYVFADMKGDLDQIGHLAGGFAWTAGAPVWLQAAHAGTISLGADAAAAHSASPIGHAGQISRRVSERFKLRQDAYIAELELEPFCAGYKASRAALRYQPLSRFPAVERDFSLVLADGATFAGIEDAIRTLGIAEVCSIDAVDLFRGKNMPEGKFALLVRVRFESRQATLTEAQLTDFSSRILAALEQKLGATLRA
ncbi:MAG TPA: phenylalanine--tRNA ligase subunit beta [Candidatus Acidoferrales bacterium]|jgi:phenylalanyl-tRNA synthetase beta chain|nr:phenylalanine--tRNA ligase subunit beta [Candidatus Acidoferrales bacterium]